MADDGGLTDHHPHAVVDEHAVADPGAGVDFNSGQRPTDLTEAAGRQFQRQGTAPQPVAQAVQADGLEVRDGRTGSPASRGLPGRARG